MASVHAMKGLWVLTAAEMPAPWAASMANALKTASVYVTMAFVVRIAQLVDVLTTAVGMGCVTVRHASVTQVSLEMIAASWSAILAPPAQDMANVSAHTVCVNPLSVATTARIRAVLTLMSAMVMDIAMRASAFAMPATEELHVLSKNARIIVAATLAHAQMVSVYVMRAGVESTASSVSARVDVGMESAFKTKMPRTVPVRLDGLARHVSSCHALHHVQKIRAFA